MTEQQRTNRWTWEVPGFEPRRSVERDDQKSASPLVRRYSISSAAFAQPSEFRRQSMTVKLHKLKDQIKHAREDYLELRQEASDLREYSNAKLDRVTRYLGVLADRAHKLDQAAYESEYRITPLVNEKRRLFNDLLTTKGNVKVFCRTRPLFEDEGQSVVEYPDEFSIRINVGDDSLANPKKEFEFDKVYGPHVGQGEIFHDVQPFVQSALDGFNVSIFAYGQTRSGKTHTMEGSTHDRGLYVRSFEELFDLSNTDATSISRYDFYVTVFELHNDQVQDLLSNARSSPSRIFMGPPDAGVELVQEKVDNPFEFCRVLKSGLDSRETDSLKHNASHLVVTIHIHYSNSVTRENLYSKLSLVDLAGSESLALKEATGEDIKDFLHVSKTLSTLGDVLSAITSKKDIVPLENSRLTSILADSLGGTSKTLMIVNICPDASNLSRTLSCLSFSSRARNAELSLGNRDTIKKWRDVANDTRKELYEKEKEVNDLRQEVLRLNVALKDANDQCTLLFNNVQKAWKVNSTLQTELKSENLSLADKQQDEREQNGQLRNQVAQLLQLEQEHKVQIQERDVTIKNLQAKIKSIELQLNEVVHSNDSRTTAQSDSRNGVASSTMSLEDTAHSSMVTKKLEEELAKRDALIEKLHEENEKLFDRLTEKSSLGSAGQVPSPSTRSVNDIQTQEIDRNVPKGHLPSVPALPSSSDKTDTAGALVKSGPEKGKTTPAGEYLTSALMEFDPEQFESFATVADGANKLLMLVLAAVIKAGASREHEILAEIRDAVFSFIRRMEPRKVMDTMLVSRVRILYIRSLIARSPELQSIKVSPVERFLEKDNTGRSRSSSRGNSPGRSPVSHEYGFRNALVDEHIHGFKINIKQEKRSKFSSIVSKVRGVEQETWRQHVTGGKLREITEDAKSFAVGNKALAALFVHTPAGELQRQIRSWLAENFDFLSVTGGDNIGGSGQLELLSTAIMDGWMAGLGTAQLPSTDALGQLLSEYTKRVYTSQLQHLKDIAGTLATEEAEDPGHVSKLRSALESVDHKRRKILQQMRSDIALLTKEEGGSPIQNPSTAVEDARLASLISLDGILKQVKDIMRQLSVDSLTKSKKKALLASLEELSERMPSLLGIDHPCAQRQIAEAHKVLESIPVEENRLQVSQTSQSTDWNSTAAETEVLQWNVLQFNTGSTLPFIIKCGANSKLDLVVKAETRVQEPKGGEIIRVAPKPSLLAEMSLEELKQVFSQLPEALSLLALARTADGTRARYARVYRTLAMKVPALKELVSEMEKGGPQKDGRTS